MTWTIFAAEQQEELWKTLNRFYKNLDSKITVESYLSICEQMGKEPKEEDMPIDWHDLPTSVQYAIHIYNRLGDRLQSEIGFIGKDYTNLLTLLKLYDISSVEFTLDIINWLEKKDIKASRDHIKSITDKAKRKNSAPKIGKKPSLRG